MEEELINLKTEIANEFWKDKFIEIGKLVAPRKKYKSLKVLSLTNSRNTEEVKILTNEHISSKNNMFSWCSSSIESLSLASEAKFNDVIDDTNFEETLLNCSHHRLDTCLPFHILNIDLTSQSPESGNGRLERELQSIEKMLAKQKEKSRGISWLMLYTTLIDDIEINIDNIKTNSDEFSVDSWGGITFSRGGSLNTRNDIKDTILEFFKKIGDKYGLNIVIDSFMKQLNSHEVLSISIMVEN